MSDLRHAMEEAWLHYRALNERPGGLMLKDADLWGIPDGVNIPQPHLEEARGYLEDFLERHEDETLTGLLAARYWAGVDSATACEAALWALERDSGLDEAYLIICRVLGHWDGPHALYLGAEWRDDLPPDYRRELEVNALKESRHAVEVLTKATDLRPDLKLALVLRGQWHADQRQRELAQSDLRAVSDWEPASLEAHLFYLNRSVLHGFFDHHDLALQDYRRHVATLPAVTDGAAWKRMSELCLDADRDDEALAALGSAIDQEPGRPDVWRDRAHAYTVVGMADAALDDLDFAIKLAALLYEPLEECRGRLQRGQVLFELGRHEVALEDFTRVVEVREEAVRDEMEQRQKDEELMGRPILHLPGEHETALGQAYYGRAHTYAAMGRKGEADADFEKAIQLSPDPDIVHDAQVSREALVADIPILQPKGPIADATTWVEEIEQTDQRLEKLLRRNVEQMLRLIRDTNLTTPKPVFVITDRTNIMVHSLAYAAHDEHSFGDFIEALYQVVWETSNTDDRGKTLDQLFGGVNSRPQPLSDLYAYRNHKAHDPGQKGAGYERSLGRRLGRCNERWIGKLRLEEPTDYQRAQCALVAELVGVLKELRDIVTR